MKNHHDSLEGISTFVQVVESGSFTSAATELGHSVSYISKEVTRLEERLGARLLNRTTRSLSLTEIGKMYFEKTRNLVLEAREAEQSINSLQDKPTGRLKVSLPLSFGQSHLLPVITEYMRRYPEIRLNVDFSSRLVDMVGEGFDVAVRMGESKDSNLISRKIISVQMMTVASPEYLQNHGIPQQPEDLRGHRAVKYVYNQVPITWEYQDSDGKPINLDLPHQAETNNLLMMLELVKGGVGIGRLPEFICQSLIESGELVAVLQDYEPPKFGVYVVFPHRHFLSAKVRAFTDLVAEFFKKPL
ncbi:LysR family transcriptional regulator [Thiomicrorhabdus heinhorstiae]|uniref:LysR family transcriptional regulator n=1 Tax=Thiomicrorhabdus heinhorstiae TaxID=2748010 RepID=A0ABS0BVA3_9GAMM|nr:LysR family transcriptional regulator [Thiomicrorhabdus heinhorstiae]MBF6057739.1 LysR family transcriptional regulator [Thiomicrorhabdus heinhorstiae]